jgi:hypothetical protein
MQVIGSFFYQTDGTLIYRSMDEAIFTYLTGQNHHIHTSFLF